MLIIMNVNTLPFEIPHLLVLFIFLKLFKDRLGLTWLFIFGESCWNLGRFHNLSFHGIQSSSTTWSRSSRRPISTAFPSRNSHGWDVGQKTPNLSYISALYLSLSSINLTNMWVANDKWEIILGSGVYCSFFLVFVNLTMFMLRFIPHHTVKHGPDPRVGASACAANLKGSPMKLLLQGTC